VSNLTIPYADYNSPGHVAYCDWFEAPLTGATLQLPQYEESQLAAVPI